jgi:hypothetical protein
MTTLCLTHSVGASGSGSAPLSLCCHLLSTSGFTSISSGAFAVTPQPLDAFLWFGWLSRFPAPRPLPLVAPPPGASASTIHHASTFRCAPLAWLVVALPGASPPFRRDSARFRLSLVRLFCCIVRRLGLSYGWLLCCLRSHSCLL